MFDHAHSVRVVEARSHLAVWMHSVRGDLSDEQFAGLLDRLAAEQVRQDDARSHSYAAMACDEMQSRSAPSDAPANRLAEIRSEVSARVLRFKGELPNERFARLIDRIAEHQFSEEIASKEA